MNYAIITAGVSVIINLFIGGFVYYKNRTSFVNKVFALISLCIANWSLCRVLVGIIHEAPMALFWERRIYTGAVFIPSLFVHLALLWVRKSSKRFMNCLYGFSLFLFIFSFTPLFVLDVVPTPILGFKGVPAPFYYVFLLFFMWGVSYGLYILFKARRELSGIKRNALSYYIIAVIFAVIAATINFLLALGIKIPPLNGPMILVYVVLTGYTIIKYRLLDIDVVIKKTITYTLLLLSLLVPCYFLIMLEQKITFNTVDTWFSVFMLCLLILIAFMFPRIKVKTERTVEQILFKKKYDYQRVLNKFSRSMVSVLELDDLLNDIIETVSKTMGLEKTSILLYDEKKKCFLIQASIGLEGKLIEEVQLEKDDEFIRWLGEKNEIIVREELEMAMTNPRMCVAVERMKWMESQVCIPLVAKEKLIGMINLDNKGSGDMYTNEDIELLTTLANQASIALDNSQLFKDLKQSRLYMRRADRLASLGTLAAGLAHEIRNPLVAIKTFTQLLPQRFDDVDFREHFLDITVGEVERICRLVNELLDFARPSEPNLQKEEINNVVDKVVLLAENEFKGKSIQVVKNYGQDLPMVLIDREQIKQVLLNLILNAVQASHENGRIEVNTRFLGTNEAKNFVQIEISDNGEGISQEDIENLFNPFFTTKQKGSGLGLAISHQIIQEHQGSIEVKSEMNKGASFLINLPMNPNHLNRRKK